MVDILDHRGLPMPKKATPGPATEPQTASVGYLYREFSEHPSRGLTPAKLASILEDAEQGRLENQARLAEDMEEKDAHLFAELSKRRRALLGLDWNLRPPKDATPLEKEWTGRLEGIIRELEWEDIVYDASAAILYGYANLEYDWDRSEGEWSLKSADYRPADWFMTPAHNRDQLVLRTLDGLGEELRQWGWLSHVHKAKSGYLTRGGLARILAWPYLFRNYSARDLAEFLEIHGLPLRLGKYPAGASDTEKSTLMKAVVNIGHAAAGIIPQGMQIDFQEAAKGSSDPFMSMMRWAESSMSKAILGGTLTSDTSASGGGAYALGEVHNEVRHDILTSDAKQIARTMTRDLVSPLARLNTPLRRMPQFVFETEQPEDIKLFADALPRLVRGGMKIPVSWAHNKLGIPQPEEGEEVLSFTPQPAPTAIPPQPARTVALRADQDNDGLEDFPDQEAIDEALEAFTDGDLNEQMLPILEPVMAIAAEGPEALRDALDDLFPDMDDAKAEERLTRALFVAELWGQIHGQQ